jgi:hypothetical protein
MHLWILFGSVLSRCLLLNPGSYRATAGIGDETHGLFGVIRPVEKEEEEDSHD